jgi:hypothetical protein
MAKEKIDAQPFWVVVKGRNMTGQVIDDKGREVTRDRLHPYSVVSGHNSEADAGSDMAERNSRAESLGIAARYVVVNNPLG